MPSACAEKLAQGEADAGLIPSIEFRRIPDLVRVGGLGIAADSEVRSVLLVSKVPRGKIRSVSLDPASRTSAVLVRLLLNRVYGLDPEFHAASSDQADARLVIGDPALKARLQGQVVLDLAAEWKSWTGYPFVFAFWAVRREAWRDDLPQLFASAHRRSLDHFDEMVAEEAAQIGGDGTLSRAMIEDYLRHS